MQGGIVSRVSSVPLRTAFAVRAVTLVVSPVVLVKRHAFSREGSASRCKHLHEELHSLSVARVLCARSQSEVAMIRPGRSVVNLHLPTGVFIRQNLMCAR